MTRQPVYSISRSDPEAGFSLVELAVVLVVVGLLMGLSLPVLQTYAQRSKILKTREHQKTIHSALKVYQQSHPRQILPCPGDPKAGESERGIADCRTRNQEGIVPYRTLGLSERMARDGYNRYFTYAVEHNLTRPMDDFRTIKGGHIQVIDENGLDVIDGSNTLNFITFVLISHGESGEGAFLSNGQRIPVNSSAGHIKHTNANGHPQYQCGGKDHVYWISQMVFRSAGYTH